MRLNISSIHEYNLDDIPETSNVTFTKALDITNQRYVGIKIIRIPRDISNREAEQLRRDAETEIRAMLTVGDMTPAVPCFLDRYYDENSRTLYIIMQWIEGSELTDKMKVHERQFLQWMIDLCSILLLMDRRNLHHKDIKPSNIMIDEANHLILIDFNISVITPNLVNGTPNYRAPEMKANFTNNFSKADMFSIGVMMYEYYTGHVPVEGEDYAMAHRRFQRISTTPQNVWTRFDEPIKICSCMTSTVNDIIKKCMCYHPDDRYSGYDELRRTLIQARKEMN